MAGRLLSLLWHKCCSEMHGHRETCSNAPVAGVYSKVLCSLSSLFIYHFMLPRKLRITLASPSFLSYFEC